MQKKSKQKTNYRIDSDTRMNNIQQIEQSLIEAIINEIDLIASSSSSYIDAIVFYCE